jgi:DNA primase
MESNWVDFKAIKRAVTIQQALEHYNVKLRTTGKKLRGRCPIHRGEGADTFHANTAKNAFHCFSCQAKGNVLDFVAAMESCGVRDAALKLCEWFSISTPALDGDEAGRKAAAEIAMRLAHKLWVRVAEVPDGKQPDQLSTEELRILVGVT